MADMIILRTAKPVSRVEVARSFSYKLNCAIHGGAPYESRDFFCSQKAECAIEDAAEVSAALYAFCRAQVLASVREYIADMNGQRARRGQPAVDTPADIQGAA